MVDFAVSVDHRKNLKEFEKKDKYLDLAKELKKLWNMKVTIVPIVFGAFGTITKGLLKGLDDLEIGGRVETIQMTALIRTARIVTRVLETWCHSNSSEKPSTNTDVRNSKGVNNNKWDSQNYLEFWRTIGATNLNQTTRQTESLQKMRICRQMDFAVLADHREELEWIERKIHRPC